MRVGRNTNDDEARLELTPMIDVTFLILVFFLCTLRFKSLDGKLGAYLPKDAGPSPTETVPTETIDVRITETPNGRVYRIGPRSMRTLAALGAELGRLYRANPERPVVLDPALGVTHDAVVHVLDEVLQCGFDEVRFSSLAR